jgi:ABC-type polysaccharide/polyol phosphate export systems, permease component
MNRALSDSYIMFKRCLIKTLRSPEAVLTALFVPVIMMILFGYVFGSVASIEGGNYIDFIVPGIIVQCICNASISTSLNVHNDMTTGIIDRFRSMQIAKSAFISGHVWMSVLRNIIITTVTFGAAYAIGFRPTASLKEWGVIAGILILFIIAITWFAVVIGLIAKNDESISGAIFLLTIFVFLSSAFAPIDSLPTILKALAKHQPMTLVIEALRGLMMDTPLDNEIMIAFAWCVGITVVCFLLAVRIYKSKLTK